MILAIELTLHGLTSAVASCAVQQRLATAAINEIPTEALIAQLLLLLRRAVVLGGLLWLLLLLEVNVSRSRYIATSAAPSDDSR